MDKHGAIEGLARVGYAARGIVYVAVGAFAMMAARSGGETVDTRGAVAHLLDQPFGRVLMWVVAIGLIAHAAWRVVQALADPDGHGDDAKGRAIRLGLVGSAAFNGLLGLFALSLVSPLDGGAGDGGGDFVSRLLGFEQSRWLLWAIALVPLVVGIAHFVKAWRASFERYFQADEATMRYVRPVSRIGLVARGLVFVIIAALLAFGGAHYSPSDPPGLKDALDALRGLPAGPTLLALMGAGLVAFALYSFAEALWRRIDPSAVDRALPGAERFAR